MWPDAIHRELGAAKVRLVGYVPDAGHKRLIELCQADKAMRTVVLTTEEEGIGLATGAWLGGERCVLLMQSSGVGNIVNALGTVKECRFPLAMLVTMRVDFRRYKHPALVFSFMGITTLLLISVFFLDRSHNTHRWIHAGGFSFQPSELAKPVLILFLAYFLESRAKSMDDVRNTLMPAATPILMFLGLIVLEPDLGTAIACAGIA